MSNSAIKRWPVDDRPREKLLKLGERALSDSELLSILLRTGIKGISVIDLARNILDRFGSFRVLSQVDSLVWGEFKGLGPAKLSQIKAAIEIGRRFREEELKEVRPRIKNAKDIVGLLMPRMRDLKIEVFKAVLLNAQNRVIAVVDITEGTVNKANPVIREIFQKALANFASALICVHNHPGGDPAPSVEDKIFTSRLFEAGDLMEIKVLDHIIIGNNSFYSFNVGK
ncbi:MAG: DNA repair protein RadC [Candidatus Omnitrophica bacterium]|nr:DNA repair protein RadC [Candidatus Omnitrophota bacterium]MDE2222632.1 DNA repair protein RadC [Candidatus Omnitrophota bacterium]